MCIQFEGAGGTLKMDCMMLAARLLAGMKSLTNHPIHHRTAMFHRCADDLYM